MLEENRWNKELENQIVQYENDITKTQKEKNLISNLIKYLKV